MKKLKLRLEIDALRVESFATGASPEGEGTVRAHGTDGTGPGLNSCAGPSCGPYTCAHNFCVVATDNYYDCGTGSVAPTQPSGLPACVTGLEYTWCGGDSCDVCELWHAISYPIACES